MAVGWKCHYGWFKGVRVASTGGPLNGSNISDLHYTDADKYFIISGTTEPITPRDTHDIGLDEALVRLSLSWTERKYASIIPCRLYNTVQEQLAPGVTTALLAILPNIFQQSPILKLHEGHIYTLEPNEKYTTFAYLWKIKRIFDGQGNIYRVEDDGTITQIIPSDYAFFFNGFDGYDGTINNGNQTLRTHVFDADGGITRIHIFFAESEDTGAFRVYTTIHKLTEAEETAVRNSIFRMNIQDPDSITDPDDPETDPYTPPFSPSDPSGPGGGGGSLVIPPSDATPLPTGGDLPNPSALGLYHIYNPSTADMIALGQELYQVQDSAVKEMSKLTSNAMEAILSVHCLPYQPASGGSVAIQIGHYTATASAAVVSSDHEIIDCGSVTIDEIWGSYLDYNMQIKLFLPFVGFIPLDPDDVVGKTVQVLYIADNATGAFCAIVRRVDDGVVLGTFGGNCSYQIPLTSTNYSEIVNAITQLASTALAAGAGLASGGLAAPMVSGLASSALNVATAKKHYDTAGGLGTNTGFMGIRVPYLKIMVPNACVPTNQNKYKGYPAYMTKRLGDLSGYTEVDAIHLEMIPATPEELQAIRSRLKAGVIL